MQITLRPYVAAGVAVVGASLIAATPIVAPNAAQHAIKRTVELAASADPDLVSMLDTEISTIGNDIFAAHQWVAGVVDPNLVGAPANVAAALSAVESIQAHQADLVAVWSQVLAGPALSLDSTADLSLLNPDTLIADLTAALSQFAPDLTALMAVIEDALKVTADLGFVIVTSVF